VTDGQKEMADELSSGGLTRFTSRSPLSHVSHEPTSLPLHDRPRLQRRTLTRRGSRVWRHSYHGSPTGLALSLERTLLVFSGVLVFGDIRIGNPKILLASNGRFTLFSSCTHFCYCYRHCLFLGSVNYDPFSRRNQEAKTFYCSSSSRASHRAIS